MSIKRTRLVLSSLFAVAVLAATWAAPLDGSHVPIVIAPSSSSINTGDAVAMTITMDGAVTSNTTLYLSSDSPLISVPSTAVVGTGNSQVTIWGNGTTNRPAASAHLRPTEVHITATANGGSAQTTITVS